MGTSAGVPTRSRNVAGIALSLPQRGEWWLFDCGEGTQHRILRSHLSLGQLTRIFITHLHGDHIFGLPGLLATGNLAAGNRRTHVYGPAGLEHYLRASRQHTEAESSLPVEVHSTQSGEIFADDGFIVDCLPLKHRVPTFGYRVTERDHPGRFRVEEAVRLGIPEGPLYGKLKRGETITLPDNRQIDGVLLSEPVQAGRKFVYCSDTTLCDTAIELARDADVLVHEATFAKKDEELARRSQHSTATMAAQVALEAKAQSLILTHISPRYTPGSATTPDDLLTEARAIFPHTELARDLLSVEVARRERSA